MAAGACGVPVPASTAPGEQGDELPSGPRTGYSIGRCDMHCARVAPGSAARVGHIGIGFTIVPRERYGYVRALHERAAGGWGDAFLVYPRRVD